MRSDRYGDRYGEIVWGNGMSGLDPHREIALALERLPYGAPRRALKEATRPAIARYGQTVRAAEDTCRAVLQSARDRFDADLRAAPPGDPFRTEHALREAAQAVTRPARDAFAAAVEAAKAEFRAALAGALAEAERLADAERA